MTKSALIRFEILDAEGRVVGSSGEQPFRLEHGDSRLPSKLSSAVLTMQAGQSAKVPVKAADAFGEIDPKKRFRLDPSAFQEKPQPGMAVQLQTESGEKVQARVVEVTAEGVNVDANHPLAGKDLVFAVTVLEVEGAPSAPERTSPTPAPSSPAAPPSPLPTPERGAATSALIRFEIVDAEGQAIGSSGEEPFRLEQADSRLPPKLTSAVFTMQPGQAAKIPLKAADAFGEIDPKKRFRLDPSAFKEKPQIGMAVQLQTESGEKVQARVVEVTAEGINVDANHPLAGKDLVFAVTVLETEGAPAASSEPVASSEPAPSQNPTAAGSPPFPPSPINNSDIPELPPPPPPEPPKPGMGTVGFLDTSGYNIANL